MICTWLLTMAGFILIFVELKGWSSEQNPHAILGTITTIICFIQPIGAAFRPHPGHKHRPLFNWGHWLGGNLGHILASKFTFVYIQLDFKFLSIVYILKLLQSSLLLNWLKLNSQNGWIIY